MDNSFSIVSYNVCWEAMTETNTPGNPSATKTCKSGRCRQNVLSWLDREYDICCLQESSFNCPIPDLIKLLPLKSTDQIIHSQSGPEPMVTIIDKSRWLVMQAQGYEFSPGRPIQCIYLLDKYTNKKLILVNVHAGHHHHNNIFNLWTQIKDQVVAWNDYDGLIVAGDYNAESWHDEFLHSSIPLYCSETHNTCCHLDNLDSYYKNDQYQTYNLSNQSHKPIRPCDYISHTSNLECIASYSVQVKGPASDHLPIISRLQWKY